MRWLAILATTAALGTGHVSGRPAAAEPPASVENEPESPWSFSVSAYTYFVTDDRDYVQPTLAADRDWLHLEARFNYEAQETGSAWVGYNFGGGGDAVTWELTGMLGGVFGDTTGIAPGYKGSLTWARLYLYSEGELVFDTGESSDSFFYNWSEVTLAPAEWCRLGLVTQRTRAYETDRDIQRGLLVGFSHGNFELTTHVFNPDDSDPIVVVAVALGS